MGKNALIHNEFPRSAWLEAEFSVLHAQVRTVFSQKLAFFGLGTRGCQNTRVICLGNEPDGRFEPVSPGLLNRHQFVLRGLLLGEEPCPGVPVLVKGQGLAKVGVCEAAELAVDFSGGGVDCHHLRGDRFTPAVLFGANLSDKDLSKVVGQSMRSHCGGDLTGDFLLADVGLGAVLFHPLGAAEVVVALLGFGGDKTAALAAAEESPVQERFQPRRLGLGLLPRH